jgi:hypothetical protein
VSPTAMTSQRCCHGRCRHRTEDGAALVTFANYFEYARTCAPRVPLTQADSVADQLTSREHGLRRLPLPYSLALRLRDAGVAREVVCEYVDVEEPSLDGFYRIAEAKLVAVLEQRLDVARSRAAGCNSGCDDDGD